MGRIIDAFAQFFDNDGSPLVNGWLEFLVSGTTSSQKDTYSDVSETIPNTNPVQLDASGRCPSVFGQGSYRVVLYTNDPVVPGPDVQIAQFDPVSSGSSDGQLSDWNGEATYNKGDIVRIAPDTYYRSLINNNQGSDPETAAPGAWEQIEFVDYWDSTVIYSINDRVRIDDGRIAVSKTDDNTGNNPITDRTNWKLEGVNEYGTPVTGAGTDSVGDFVATDSSGGSFDRTLPGSPADQDTVTYKDVSGTWATNPVTLLRNGKAIMGLNEDITLNLNYRTVELKFFESENGWRL